MTGIAIGSLDLRLSASRGHQLSRRAVPVGLAAFRPVWPSAVPLPRGILGRAELLAGLGDALVPGRPLLVHGPSGFGVSTVLQAIAGGATGIDPERVPVILLDAAGLPAPDLLRTLVTRLYRSELGDPDSHPAIPTGAQCRELLARQPGVVLLDHVPDQPGWLAEVAAALPGCALVLGASGQVAAGCPVPVTRLAVPGLAEQHAVRLVAGQLPDPLDPAGIRAAGALAAAVHGSPRRLGQAAALVRVGARTLRELAATLDGDPSVLDELAVAALPGTARRVLAAMVPLGGLPVGDDVVAALSGVDDVRPVLRLLRGRALVDARVTTAGPRSSTGTTARYADPADPAAGARRLITRLLATGRTGDLDDDWPAAVAVLGLAARRGDHATVVTLAGVLEQRLLVAGAWTVAAAALELGMLAARHRADPEVEAYLAHQRGVLYAVSGEPAAAARNLSHALDLRRGSQDHLGVARTMVALTEVTAPTPANPPALPAPLPRVPAQPVLPALPVQPLLPAQPARLTRLPAQPALPVLRRPRLVGIGVGVAASLAGIAAAVGATHLGVGDVALAPPPGQPPAVRSAAVRSAAAPADPAVLRPSPMVVAGAVVERAAVGEAVTVARTSAARPVPADSASPARPAGPARPATPTRTDSPARPASAAPAARQAASSSPSASHPLTVAGVDATALVSSARDALTRIWDTLAALATGAARGR